MGTTLNGTTPQNTYPSLIKVTDNTALTTTLKTISDGQGNDTPLKLATDKVEIGDVSYTEIQYLNGVTSAVQTQLDAKQATLVSGTNIKTINSTSLLGSGDIVIGGGSPSGVAGAIQFSNGSAFASDATNLFYDDTNDRLGVGTNTPTARLHIKGSGTTAATNALLVQNSAGSTAFIIKDDLTTLIGTSLTVGNSLTADRAISQGGSSALINNTSFNSQQGFPRFGLTTDASVFLYQASFVPTTGSGSFAVFRATPTINQTGGANGITRGLFINATLTSAADFRAIETTAGNVVFGNLPTSSAGLPSGAIYNDAGTLKIA